MKLRDDDAQAGQEQSNQGPTAVDLFSLSRSIGADGEAAVGGEGAAREGAAGGHAGEREARRPLGADEQRTLSKLVGCLTKEGKRSRAQRVLGDALHIINAQLRKGGSTAAAGGSGKS